MKNLKYRDERNKCRLELIKYELIITLIARLHENNYVNGWLDKIIGSVKTQSVIS